VPICGEENWLKMANEKQCTIQQAANIAVNCTATYNACIEKKFALSLSILCIM